MGRALKDHRDTSFVHALLLPLLDLVAYPLRLL